MLIVVRPGAEGINIHALYAVISAALVAGNVIMTKRLAETEGTTTIMVYHAGVLAAAYAVPAWWMWVPPTWTELALIGGIAVLMSAVQVCMIRGYREAEASAAQPLEYVRLVYAATDRLPDLCRGADSVDLGRGGADHRERTLHDPPQRHPVAGRELTPGRPLSTMRPP